MRDASLCSKCQSDSIDVYSVGFTKKKFMWILRYCYIELGCIKLCAVLGFYRYV